MGAWRTADNGSSSRSRADSDPNCGIGKVAADGTANRFRREALPSRIKAVGLFYCFIFILAWRGHAQNPAPSEYQIKAAFVYDFAKFVEWPPGAFAATNSPLVIGVLGKNVFGGDMERTIHSKSIGEHPLEFKEFHAVSEATNCQVLFISTSEKDGLAGIIKQLRGSSVLTVGEMDHFTDAGGMINLVMQSNKVRFQVNNDEAAKAGLKISSRLLSLALPSAH